MYSHVYTCIHTYIHTDIYLQTLNNCHRQKERLFVKCKTYHENNEASQFNAGYLYVYVCVHEPMLRVPYLLGAYIISLSSHEVRAGGGRVCVSHEEREDLYRIQRRQTMLKLWSQNGMHLISVVCWRDWDYEENISRWVLYMVNSNNYV